MESFGCFAKAILKKNKHQNNASSTTAVGHYYKKVLNSKGQMKICTKHQTFKIFDALMRGNLYVFVQ